MQSRVLLHRAILGFGTVVLVALVTVPAAAVPHFSRQYEVSCGMCHATVPKLNETGQEFFANGYRFPGFPPASPGTLPLSALGQVRYENFISNDADRTHLREVELIVAGPLGDKGGSYFVEWLPFNNQFKSNGTTSNRSGRFEDIVVTVPVGHNGSLALGQFRAASQVDVSRRLSISTPLAFGAKTGSFAISSRSPGFGYSYFQPDEPGDVANGWTHSIVVPFPGELTLNDDFSFRSRPEGVFLESYKREGLSSTGATSFWGKAGCSEA